MKHALKVLAQDLTHWYQRHWQEYYTKSASLARLLEVTIQSFKNCNLLNGVYYTGYILLHLYADRACLFVWVIAAPPAFTF